MPHVYIAGRMRGIPEFNFPAFEEAVMHLEEQGHYVFSPAQRDLDIGFDPTGLTGNEDLDELGFDLRKSLAEDLAYICEEATEVYLLKGWSQSRGARAEKAVAEALGIDVLYQLGAETEVA